MATTERYQTGDSVKLLPPYQPIIGQVSGITYRDPLLYQIDCEDGSRLPYVEAAHVARPDQ